MMRKGLLVLTGILTTANAFAGNLACKAYGNGRSTQIDSSENRTEEKVIVSFKRSLAWYPDSTKFEVVYSRTFRDSGEIIITGKELTAEKMSNHRPQAFQIRLQPDNGESARYGKLEIGDYGQLNVYDNFLAKHQIYDIQCFSIQSNL